jgi:hypothetical protein
MTQLEGDLSSGRPAAAFEHSGERKLAGTFAEAFSDKNGEAIKQGYRQRTPLDDRLAQRIERRSQEGRVTGDDNAAIEEQATVAVFGEPCEAVQLVDPHTACPERLDQ